MSIVFFKKIKNKNKHFVNDSFFIKKFNLAEKSVAIINIMLYNNIDYKIITERNNMKLYTNRKYTAVAVYAGIVIALNVLLVVAVFKFSTILNVLGKLVTVLNPIIWGLVIAFLMNPIMVKFEQLFRRKLANKSQKKKFLRAVSVSISSIVFLGIVIGLIYIVVPELVNSVMDIFNNASKIASNIQSWINKLFRNYPDIESGLTERLNAFTSDFDTIITRIQPMLENILSGAWGVVTFLKNFVLGFICSIYMLCSKETLLAQVKKMLISSTRKSTCEKVMKYSSQANKIFAGFLSGKIIDSIIIGLMCFIGLTIMDMPYNIMISVLIGITNIIPFFGPIIGAIPSVALILFIDPKKAIFLAIFLLILQQFDGNILGPKILGDSTGLPGFWVLVSLLICGGLFGFVGMVLAVPVFALLYSFTREFVESRLRKKKLPVDTSYYMDDVEHLYKKPAKHIPLTRDELETINIPSADLVNEADEEEPQDDDENDE